VPAVATVAVELDLANVVLPLKRDSGPIRVIPAEMVVGSFVDCRDTVGKWLVATVKKLKGAGAGCRAYVHFDEWDTKWDAWVGVESGRFAALGRFTSSQAALTVALLPGVLVDCSNDLLTWHSGVITDVKKNRIQCKYSTGLISAPPYNGNFADPGVMTLGLKGDLRVGIKPRLPGGGFGDELEGTVKKVYGLQFSFKQTLEGQEKTRWCHVSHDCVRII
jgi:hypothetical protein